MGLEQNNHPQLGCAEVNGMLLQNDTLHVWYAKSHAACQLLTEGGTGWAPGGDLLYSTSKDGGRSWSNTTVKPLLGAPERNTRLRTHLITGC